MCHVIRMFLAGYERGGEGRYRDTALDGARTLVERFARRKQTPCGNAYAWSHAYRPNDRSKGLLAGHSHGLGNLMDTLLDAYEAAPDDALKAELVVASATEIDGTLACPDRVHFKRVNLALDYGQTGVVMGLAGAGKYLEDDEFIEAAKKVADYITQRAVPEGGGYKFAQFYPLPQ